jgi:UDP-glucose 4-epimerase
MVTGGAGYIGSYVVDALLQWGKQVVVVDDLRQTGMANLAHCANRVQLERVDIRDAVALRRAFDRARPRTMFHLAALHYIPYCAAHPAETLDINAAGTQNVADCCERFPVANVFYASTGAVYAPSAGPSAEDSAVGPIGVYGISKLAGENAIRSLKPRDGRAVRIGRYFNAVGPRETNPHIVAELYSQIHASPRPSVALRLGNLTPRRDYIHVRDLALASLAVMAGRREREFDVVNIGSGRAHSVAELVELVADITGRRLEIRQESCRCRPSDRPVLCAGTSRLCSEYGYRLQYSLREALEEVFSSCRLSRAAAVTGAPEK